MKDCNDYYRMVRLVLKFLPFAFPVRSPVSFSNVDFPKPNK